MQQKVVTKAIAMFQDFNKEVYKLQKLSDLKDREFLRGMNFHKLLSEFPIYSYDLGKNNYNRIYMDGSTEVFT